MPRHRGPLPATWRAVTSSGASPDATINDHVFYPVVRNGVPQPDRCFTCSGSIEQHKRLGWDIVHAYAWEVGCRCMLCRQERKACLAGKHGEHKCRLRRD